MKMVIVLMTILSLSLGFAVFNSANSVLDSTMKSYTTPQQNSIDY